MDRARPEKVYRRAEARRREDEAIGNVKGHAHRGPKGRNVIATPVRAWFWRFGFLEKRRRCETGSCRPFGPQSRFLETRSTASRPWLFHLSPAGFRARSWIPALLTAHRALLAVFFLLSAFCLLPIALTPSLAVGLLPRALSQNETPSPQVQPTPAPAPSPSPSPTPPPNLHQWGAVTSFHGLPSDRTHAIAQTEFGVTWFATDGGLARYDGRRTNAINSEGLPLGRILALKADESGGLWIGTDNGATLLANEKFEPIKETAGKVITNIITPQPGRALMASESGQIFDCQVKQPTAVNSTNRTDAENDSPTFAVRTIPAQPLQSADKDHPGPLKITSLALVGDKVYAGTQSRGLILIENGEAREVVSKPRSYFINALEVDAHGRLWTGARVRIEESGLFDNDDPLKPAKANGATGPVTAITRGSRDDIWVATDGRGAFHFQGEK